MKHLEISSFGLKLLLIVMALVSLFFSGLASAEDSTLAGLLSPRTASLMPQEPSAPAASVTLTGRLDQLLHSPSSKTSAPEISAEDSVARARVDSMSQLLASQRIAKANDQGESETEISEDVATPAANSSMLHSLLNYFGLTQ